MAKGGGGLAFSCSALFGRHNVQQLKYREDIQCIYIPLDMEICASRGARDCTACICAPAGRVGEGEGEVLGFNSLSLSVAGNPKYLFFFLYRGPVARGFSHYYCT